MRHGYEEWDLAPVNELLNFRWRHIARMKAMAEYGEVLERGARIQEHIELQALTVAEST